MEKKCFVMQYDVTVNENLPYFDGVKVYVNGQLGSNGTTVRLATITNPVVSATVKYSGEGSLKVNNNVVTSPYVIDATQDVINTTAAGSLIIKNVSQLKQFQIQIANITGSSCDFLDVSTFLDALPNVNEFGIDYRNSGVNLVGDYTDSGFIKFLTQCVNGITFKSNNFPVDIDNLLTLMATEMSPSANTTVMLYIDGNMMTNRPEGLNPNWSSAGSYVTFTNNTTTYPKGWYVSNSSGDPVN